MGPLIFPPLFKRRIWGGQNLTRLGKRLPPGQSIGESWELADLEQDQSAVRDGPLAGKTLGELVRDHREELLGEVPLFEGRFPLLIKFLDACQNLSVQVHPDQAMARKLGGQVRVKHEAWYIIDAAPDGAIYHGLIEGIDRPALARAIAEGRTQQVLRRVPVKPGECYYLPSGTLHALGAGVLVAEIQTPSDVTYRVFDWDRVDPESGQPRELHIEQALECIHFDTPPPKQVRSHVVSVWASVTRLVTCDPFVIEQVRMKAGVAQEVPYGGLAVWIVLQGRGRVGPKQGGPPLAFSLGDTVVIPADLRGALIEVTQDAMWLEVTVPLRSDLAGFGRPEGLRQRGLDSGLLQINPPEEER
ncbi:MAG: type I phosphomannose isomerase catalytic subunit [Phycisphaerae bacterium]